MKKISTLSLSIIALSMLVFPSYGQIADGCNDITEQQTLHPVTNPIFSSIEYYCAQGTLENATPDSIGGQTGCNFSESPTVWFAIECDDIAAQLFTTVTSPGNWDPIWSVYMGDCGNLTNAATGNAPPCSNGDNSPDLYQVAIDGPPATYYIAITADPNGPPIDDPNFEVCAATIINVLVCLGDIDDNCEPDPTTQIMITGRENSDQEPDYDPEVGYMGPFCPGEQVDVHIEIFYDATESGADWFIGLVPDFGIGWDMAGYDFTASPPTGTGGNGGPGTWHEEGSDCAPTMEEPVPHLCTYYDDFGVLRLCNSLCESCPDCAELGLDQDAPLPSGYFWTGDGSNSGCVASSCKPGEQWGIGSTTSQINWDFSLTVREFADEEEYLENNDLQITFQPFSDGGAGCWEDPVGECLIDRKQLGPNWKISKESCYLNTCLPDGINFTSQEEVDSFPMNFPDCKVIGGDVCIGYCNLNIESNITNLDSLSQIIRINGSLTIQNNPILTDLGGLNNISKVEGNLAITDNIKLIRITALRGLTMLSGYLKISNNYVLTNIIGIENLDANSIESFDNNPDLTIMNNPDLSWCNAQSVCNFLDLIDKTAIIQQNHEGCNNDTEIQYACTFKPSDCDQEPANICEDAEILCDIEDIHDFCTVMLPPWSPNTPSPLCPGGGFSHNPSWFSFVAAAETVTLIIHVSDCSVGGNQQIGIQYGIYTDCSFTETVICQAQCESPGDIFMTSDGFIPGEDYFLFIDGCNGTICEYWIEFVEGFGFYSINDPTDITCNNLDENCDSIEIGGMINFVLEGCDNAINYSWTLDGEPINNSDSQTISLTFDEVGTYELCGRGENVCDQSEQFCKEIFVSNLNCNSISLNAVQTNVSCYGMCGGALSITKVVNGNPPYEYFWNTGEITSSIQDLCAGTYSITVNDANNCTIVGSYQINQPPELLINATTTAESTQGANDGTASVSPTGGVPPYTFLWSNDETNDTIVDLAPGIYSVLVIDANQCMISDTLVVESGACVDFIINYQLIGETCYGDCDGTISITGVSNSMYPLTYQWNNGSSSPILNNLCGGDYIITITDSIGCFAIDTITILQQNEITIEIDTVVNISSGGMGAILISTNDNGSFSYNWTGPDDFSSTILLLINLINAGCYNLEIIDNISGCTRDTSICIEDLTGIPDLIDASSIKIYPNPSSNDFTIDFTGTAFSPQEIALFNVNGERVKLLEKVKKRQIISTNKMKEGLYIIKITIGQSSVYKKIVLIK